MPPPNITGKLHLGHAMFSTLQDIIIRHKRMTGYDALWTPGTDHAGLATQEKLMNELALQDINPSYDEFCKFAEDWKQNYQGKITEQLRSLGSSCYWSKERFTLDNQYTDATITAFNKCNDANMLYRKDNQWYLDMKQLADEIISCYENGEITIIPESEGKTFCHFLRNIEPWCISRQIWWGHRMPIWYNENGDWCSAYNEEDAKSKLSGNLYQEKDCLDTWFSSSLWPFAILGWPNNTEDYNKYYPADIIETADDILFFWCARMLMMGKLLTGKLPFKTIYLHGIIRDKHGRKMSKSLDNGIDPNDIITKYGCDTLRFALAENTSPGLDMKISDEIFITSKKFINKLWNCSKFILMHYERNQSLNNIYNISYIDPENIKMIHDALDEYNFRKAAGYIRHFIKDQFCDWWIETSKEKLYADDEETLKTGLRCLEEILKISHPFIPYITEYIWDSFHYTLLIDEQM